MVTVNTVAVKEIVSKSKIPGVDYVLNPYVGCTHGCVYCYAAYMRKFSGHTQPWGHFLDVKIGPRPLKPSRLFGKNVMLSSVTDPYNPFEKRYQNTRTLLRQLIPCQARVSILTKSALVLRDLDLLTQLPGCEVGFSFSGVDEALRQKLEPNTSTVQEKINALKILHEHALCTAVMAAPLLPGISQWQEIIERTRAYTDAYRFDALNMATPLQEDMFRFIRVHYPQFLPLYREIYVQGNRAYWKDLSEKIRTYCKKNQVRAEVFF